jgi:hypothetical protein
MRIGPPLCTCDHRRWPHWHLEPPDTSCLTPGCDCPGWHRARHPKAALATLARNLRHPAAAVHRWWVFVLELQRLEAEHGAPYQVGEYMHEQDRRAAQIKAGYLTR